MCLRLLQKTPRKLLLGSVACNNRPAEQGTAQTHEECSNQQRCSQLSIGYQQLLSVRAGSCNITKSAETERYLPPMHASAAIVEGQIEGQWGLQTQGTCDPGRSCAGCSGAKGRHQSATLGHPTEESLGQQPCLPYPTCVKQHTLYQLTRKAYML